jgi:hypothetical protein
MDLIFSAVMTGVLLACAYYDLKSKMVPDLFTAALWISLALARDLELAFAMSGIIFGALYLLNTIVVMSGKRFIFSWADVIGMPPYLASMILMGVHPFPIALSIVLPLLASSLTKEEVPMFVSFYGFHLIYFAMAVAM